jgi:hypothetical protein
MITTNEYFDIRLKLWEETKGNRIIGMSDKFKYKREVREFEVEMGHQLNWKEMEELEFQYQTYKKFVTTFTPTERRVMFEIFTPKISVQ